MRQALRNMKDTDPGFWNELTIKISEDLPLPDETKILPEDESLLTAELEDEDFDDSEVPIKAVITLSKGQAGPGLTHFCWPLALALRVGPMFAGPGPGSAWPRASRARSGLGQGRP